MILDRETQMFKQLQHQRYTAASKPTTNDSYISTDEDELAAEQWEPQPLDKDFNRNISSRGRRNDQINTLIDIYGDQEQFL